MTKPPKQTSPAYASPIVLSVLLTACGGGEAAGGAGYADSPSGESHAGASKETSHEHDEEPLGTITIGGLEIELAQGHGKILAGKEGHLVVKLPYSDNGSTIVRAWIGTADRTLSYVGKGKYASSHDDYDVHATAPDPLPENSMWWIELEKPDGTKLVGSCRANI